MRTARALVIVVAAACLSWLAGESPEARGRQSSGGLVRVTPLGSHAGELCRNDRALLFEDPSGVRILYDPGRTVDENDPRLGQVHAMLLSHAHTDHLGDARPSPNNPGTCAAPTAGAANPNSNFASIAAAKNAVVLAPGELSGYLGRQIQNVRGAATPACPEVGIATETQVPQSSPCTASLRPGGSRGVGNANGAVRIAAVPAVHSNGIPAALIDAPGLPAGLVGYGGGEAGFILKFTNGLTVYLTGDTGMFGDMDTIIGRYYRPNLIVLNMSDAVTLGPYEAFYVIKNLVRPASVMPTHVNEQATQDGAVRPGTRVDLFLREADDYVDVVVPLSNVTRAFDGEGRCIGCK